MPKVQKEWFIDVPWGKVSLIAWGNPAGIPVLLVHGRQDSAATFIPIVEYLPDDYYYIALDLPGHGKSDPLPIGVVITRFQLFASVDFAVQHLGWKRFVFMGHSMGAEQGLFYNVIYPHRITIFIFFDPKPSLQRLQVSNPVEYMKFFYDEYYDNYQKYVFDNRVYTKRMAVEAVMKARGLTAQQAAVVLSRNLKEIGRDMYKLSWDRRLKFPAPQNYPVDYYYQLFSTNAPPTLIISATEAYGYNKGVKKTEKLLADLKNNSKHFYIETVAGNHDVHLTSPDVVSKLVIEFLNRKFTDKAKL